MAMLHSEPPTIYGDGTQSRDFTYVANVVYANLLACERDEAVGQVMNVACGEQYTLLAFYQELLELTERKLEPVFAPARAGDVKHSQAAIDKAIRMLGYVPKVQWRDGLRQTVEWYAHKVKHG